MTTHPRRWFSFSLRTLLVILTLVGIPLAWLNIELSRVRERKAMIQELTGNGVSVVQDKVSSRWRSEWLGDREVISVIFPEGFADTSYHVLLKTKRMFPNASFCEKWEREMSGGIRSFHGKNDELARPIY